MCLLFEGHAFSQAQAPDEEDSAFFISISSSAKTHVSRPLAGITLRKDGALIIERVKKDDEGHYECVASNSEGVVKTSALVTVLGKILCSH